MILSDQPKTFVIALKDHPISEKQLQDCLSSAKEFNWNVEVSWGIYGNTLTNNSWNNIGVKSYIGKSGAEGCWFSHYFLWIKCIELNEPIVVLEHDAIIQQSWNPLEIKDSLIKLHKHYRKKIDTAKWSHPVTGYWTPSTHAYCITPDHAKTLIDASLTIGAWPADVYMGSKVIAVELLGEPELVSRQNTYSTTGNIDI